MKPNRKKWYDYMWILSAFYLILGFFNILFAWMGMFCFLIPLLLSILKGTKIYCNQYCGRGQLLSLLGNRYSLSRKKPIPMWMKSNYFRYGFLAFFLLMFGNMIFTTYLVFAGLTELHQIVTLFWSFKVPWHFAYHGSRIPEWITQYAFGFYSMMLTSTLLGVLTMILFKPRSWCVYCPMGTMTQGICRMKQKNKVG